jgi:hypothetical protein
VHIYFFLLHTANTINFLTIIIIKIKFYDVTASERVVALNVSLNVRFIDII